MYRVYALNKNERGVIEKILSDDTMGRQTIIEKDGANMGYEGKIILVVEGQSMMAQMLKDIFTGHLQTTTNGEVAFPRSLD